MKVEEFKKVLKNFPYKVRSLTIKKEDDNLFVFFNLKKYRVSRRDERIVLISRQGEEYSLKRFIYRNRKLT
jgi:hypothetical protein